MADTIDVTVAICTWNRCESLRTTLEKFRGLRVPDGLRWELLVVNNNCTDATDAVVASFEGQLPVRVLHEATPGQSRARNLAIQEARGTYLLWTDDDVLVDPEWMVALLDTLKSFDATWVFGRSEAHWPGARPTWYAERFRNYFALLDYGPKPFVVTDFDQHFYGLNFGGTLAAHRALGGFRNDFGFRGNVGGVGEDIDMFQRAFNAGMPIAYTPDALVKHIIPEARIHKSYHRRRHWVANEVYYTVLPEVFPSSAWLLGLPRFFYSKAASDAAHYARSVVSRSGSDAFYYELQLVRFGRLCLEAARNGFRRAPYVPAVVRKDSAGS